MTHEQPGFIVTACDLGHCHLKFTNAKGEMACHATMTAAQAHNLADQLHAFAHEAEVVLANVPGIVGGDAEACA